ncbi:MAG: CpaF family protein, partial [Lachnospiraceae bacterium]|nr:CpaF family protein [Lachnospiraceae bacterium]
EIMVNGYQKIFIERDGKLYPWEYGFSSEEKYLDVIQQIVGSCNRIVNESSPIVDARLPDGSRVNVVLPPIALDGAIMTIRRFPKYTYTLKDLRKMGMISGQLEQFLTILVKSKYNIMISGGTGSGKTTFLNALANQIPSDERIITIEDSAELQIRGIPNLVRLEVRNANIEGNNEIPMKELIKSALRMRPTRIIVGEVRGEEALQMLQAMNTGHSGSLSTGHANSAQDILYRLETMVLMGMDMPLPAIRQQIASALDLIIHIGRMKDGSRKVLEITEILGIKDGEIRMKSLYQWQENDRKGWNELEQKERIAEMGYWEDYQKLCYS